VMKRRIGLAALVLLLMGSVVVVWRGGRARRTAPRVRAPIRFAFPNRVGIAIPILAARRGLFEKHEIGVKAMPLSGGPACAEALFTGAADVASLGDALTVTALLRDARLRLVSAHVWGEQRYRLMVREDAPYRTIHDLAGKRVGIKKGTSIYGALLKYCEANGMARTRFTVVDIGLSLMPEALAAGSIAAFVGSEPAPSLAEQRGARALASFDGLGNVYPAMLVAHERVFKGRADALRKFLAALRAAEQLIERDADAAAGEVAQAIGLPLEVARSAMRRHSYRLRLDADILNSLRQTAEFLQTQGVTQAVPDFKCVDGALR